MALHAFAGNAGVPMSAVRQNISSHREQALEMLRPCPMIKKSQIKLAE